MNHEIHDHIFIYYLLIGLRSLTHGTLSIHHFLFPWAHAIRSYSLNLPYPPLFFFGLLSICFFVVFACRPLFEYQKLMYISLLAIYIDYVLYCTVVFNR